MPTRFRVISAFLAVLFVIAAVGAVVVAVRVTAIEHSTIRSACSDRLTADVLAAAGRALAAPPAPNPAREAAVRDIIRAADRLTHSDAVCAHGVPAPLVPTPAQEAQ